MADDISRASYRALLVPDPRIDWAAWSSSLSTLTQAGPRPGVPEAQQDTDMVLDASGDQAASSSIRLRCLGAGMPGPEAGRATHAWKNEADASTRWRGWEGALAIAGWEALEYTTTAGKWRNPHAITLDDGAILVAVTKTSRYVRAWSRDPSTGIWTESGIYDHGVAYAADAHPTLLQLPSGRVLCFFLVEATGESQVRMWYSDDRGATWTQGQRACLVSALDTTVYTPRKLRVAHANGQVLLVAWVTDTSLAVDDILLQWASSDLGARFSLVDTWAGADEESQGAHVDIAVRNETFVVGYLRQDAGAPTELVPYVRAISSAYTPLSSAEAILAQHTSNPMRWGQVTGTAVSAGRLALWCDQDGVLFAAGLDHLAGGGALREGYIARSQDGGLTWSTPGGGSAPGWGGTWWNGQDASTHPSQLTGCAQGGRQVIVHNFDASPGTADDSLCAAYVGGYSTVCLPPRSEMSKPHDHAGWERTWLPYDLPQNTGGIWTLATTGAPAITLDTATGSLQVVQASGADTTA
ncbi:MAG: hypothetical protein FJ102_23520, partial [Deltaproteobacteria bacterium]|nr:hypothetical protein [Deltaproteobacteria bacterium]